MRSYKKIVAILFLGFFFCLSNMCAQHVAIYKIKDLVSRIHNNSDTVYIVNFWATWCKPCVQELPDFEKIYQTYQGKKVKVMLVSLDFKEDLEKRVLPFLQKNKYSSEVILLDEINGNDFINQVSTRWTGSIPATLITKKNGSLTDFFEIKISYDSLVKKLKAYIE